MNATRLQMLFTLSMVTSLSENKKPISYVYVMRSILHKNKKRHPIKDASQKLQHELYGDIFTISFM